MVVEELAFASESSNDAEFIWERLPELVKSLDKSPEILQLVSDAVENGEETRELLLVLPQSLQICCSKSLLMSVALPLLKQVRSRFRRRHIGELASAISAWAKDSVAFESDVLFTLLKLFRELYEYESEGEIEENSFRKDVLHALRKLGFVIAGVLIFASGDQIDDHPQPDEALQLVASLDLLCEREYDSLSDAAKLDIQHSENDHLHAIGLASYVATCFANKDKLVHFARRCNEYGPRLKMSLCADILESFGHYGLIESGINLQILVLSSVKRSTSDDSTAALNRMAKFSIMCAVQLQDFELRKQSSHALKLSIEAMSGDERWEFLHEGVNNGRIPPVAAYALSFVKNEVIRALSDLSMQQSPFSQPQIGNLLIDILNQDVFAFDQLSIVSTALNFLLYLVLRKKKFDIGSTLAQTSEESLKSTLEVVTQNLISLRANKLCLITDAEDSRVCEMQLSILQSLTSRITDLILDNTNHL